MIFIHLLSNLGLHFFFLLVFILNGYIFLGHLVI